MASVMGLAIMSRNQAYGSFRVNFTVWRSTASTRSTTESMYACGLPFTVRNRSIEYTTSAAVSSRPFTGGLGWKRTARRSVNT